MRAAAALTIGSVDADPIVRRVDWEIVRTERSRAEGVRS